MSHISRDAAIEAMYKEAEAHPGHTFWVTQLEALMDIPAADVRPVVRGKWKDAMQSCHDSPHVKCSVCGEYYWQYFNKFNFCPNCGADMREES